METKLIPLSRISPSPMNPRKTFDEVALKELADNIEKQGLLQPITVRPLKNGEPDTYEIVCGERRYRASVMLRDKWEGLDHVAPSNRFSAIHAIVREMTDDEAFEAMVTENLQRKDVDPMEEAFAFIQLFGKGRTVEEIAARIGKSVRFVQDRMRLNYLVPEFAELVRNGRLPLTAALNLAKLDAKVQKEIHGEISGGEDTISKRAVDDAITRHFQYIDSAVWAKEPEYTGGCGKTCGECEFNSANHGCLFYEMKLGERGGKCTDATRYEEKTFAYILDYIMSHNMLPLGAEKDGRMVAGVPFTDYMSAKEKEQRKRLKEAINAAGYEVVDQFKEFSSRCWYDADDERTQKMLATGEVYPVLDVFKYSPSLELTFWYVKKKSEAQSVGGNIERIKVTDLVTTYKALKEGDRSADVAAETIHKHYTPTDDELTTLEKQLFVLARINGFTALRKTLGLPAYSSREEEIQFSAEHPEAFNACLRDFVKEKVFEYVSSARAILPSLGYMWCREEYLEALEKWDKKKKAKMEKAEKELAKLGYDTEGNKMTYTKEELDAIPLPVTHELYEQYAKMKTKHPDALLLFRVGDFYEVFGEDAETCANLLGIVKSTRKYPDGTEMALAGFPHHALDAYLPKFPRAGIKVAICESK